MGMQVEIYLADKEDSPEWTFEFEALPRIGEYLSIDAGGYFKYYNVTEIWHRQTGESRFVPCIQVQLDD
jgi:hypothetical protein